MSEVHPSDTAAQSAGEPEDKEVEEETVLKDAGVELCLDLLQPSANQQAPVELLAEVYIYYCSALPSPSPISLCWYLVVLGYLFTSPYYNSSFYFISSFILVHYFVHSNEWYIYYISPLPLL